MDRKLLKCSLLTLCCIFSSVDAMNGQLQLASKRNTGGNAQATIREVISKLSFEQQRNVSANGDGLAEQVQMLVTDRDRLTQQLEESQRAGAARALENSRLQQLNSALQRAVDAEENTLLLQSHEARIGHQEDRLDRLETLFSGAMGFMFGKEHGQCSTPDTRGEYVSSVVPASRGTPLMPASHQIYDSQMRIEEALREQRQVFEQQHKEVLATIERKIGASEFDIETLRRELRASEEKSRQLEQQLVRESEYHRIELQAQRDIARERGEVLRSQLTALEERNRQLEQQLREEEFRQREVEAQRDIERRQGEALKRQLMTIEQQLRKLKSHRYEVNAGGDSVSAGHAERTFSGQPDELEHEIEDVSIIVASRDTDRHIVRRKTLPSQKQQFQELLYSNFKSVLISFDISKKIIDQLNALTLRDIKNNGISLARIFYTLLEKRQNIDLFKAFGLKEMILEILNQQTTPISKWKKSSKLLFSQIKRKDSSSKQWNMLLAAKNVSSRNEIFRSLIRKCNQCIAYNISNEISMLLSIINSPCFFNKFGLSAKSSFLAMIEKINEEFNSLLCYLNKKLNMGEKNRFQNLADFFKKMAENEDWQRLLYTELVKANLIERQAILFSEKQSQIIAYINNRIGGILGLAPCQNFIGLAHYADTINRAMFLCSSIYATDEEIYRYALSLRQ